MWGAIQGVHSLKSYFHEAFARRGGGGYCHIWAMEVCAAVKGTLA